MHMFKCMHAKHRQRGCISKITELSGRPNCDSHQPQVFSKDSQSLKACKCTSWPHCPCAFVSPTNDGSPELSLPLKDVKVMYKDLQTVLKLTPQSTVPLELQQVVLDTFRCNICLSTPILPPAIYIRCCKCIFGCQACVDMALISATHSAEVTNAHRIYSITHA